MPLIQKVVIISAIYTLITQFINFPFLLEKIIFL